jgi:CRISPR-associated protein Cas1
MVTRTVEVSREPAHLCVRDGQMLVLRRGEPPRPLPAAPPNLVGSVPLEDLGVLMVDERDTTYTHSLLAQMAEHGAALVVCGRDHHPVGMYLPLHTHTRLLQRLDAQLAAPRPLVKRLWQQIVRAKVTAQAKNLPESPERTRLLALAKGVRSGDAGNAEAVAAAAYWPVIFKGAQITHPFRRRAGEPGAPDPNALLDYGYAVIRATVARALVAAGFLPALGLKHAGRGNPFCLADDLMEPLRPLVDDRVRYLCLMNDRDVNPTTKRELLKLLAEDVEYADRSGPLMVAVGAMIASFARALESGEGDLVFPRRRPFGTPTPTPTPTPPPTTTDTASTPPPPGVHKEKE